MDICEFEIRGSYDIGHVRRNITEDMRNLGFHDKEIAEISIIINELGSNITNHHTVDSKIGYRRIEADGRYGIEIRYEDKGPGIEDIEEVLQDGISHAGTLGGGFGAIRRLSDSFQIVSHTQQNHSRSVSPGTCIHIRKWVTVSTGSFESLLHMDSVSIISRPFPGLSISGDSYYVKRFADRDIFVLADGLGHGKEANEAAVLAIKEIEDNLYRPIEEIMDRANKKLRHTRGAVAAIAIVNKFRQELEVISLGNIDCRYVAGPKTYTFRSLNGTLGIYHGTYQTQKMPYCKGDMLILATDGISNKWEINHELLPFLRSPMHLCNKIFRDYAKSNDDATLLVSFL